jgi:hypothetical protein
MKKERMELAKQRTMMGISSNGERHMEKIMEQAMKTLSEANTKHSENHRVALLGLVQLRTVTRRARERIRAF